jgi:hypothetical protein
MTATVKRHGRYSLFETPSQHRILVLGEDEWFAWVGGEKGEILVRSDRDHERDRALQEGEFYYVDFENDPDFTDVPHLFLERDDRFLEVILPNGLPTTDDTQKRVVGTDKTIDREQLQRLLDAGASGRPEDKRMAYDERMIDEERMDGEEMADDEERSAPSERVATDRELPIPDFDELSVRGAKVRLDDLNPDELRRLRSYEAQNKMRKTLIHEIDRRLK